MIKLKKTLIEKNQKEKEKGKKNTIAL